MKRPTNFRLSEEAFELLEHLSEIKGISKTAILEMLIRESSERQSAREKPKQPHRPNLKPGKPHKSRPYEYPPADPKQRQRFWNVRILSHNKRADKHGLAHISIDDWLGILTEYDSKCVFCGTDREITIDHVKRLIDGGDNHTDNIVPLCWDCHLAKSGWERMSADTRNFFLGVTDANEQTLKAYATLRRTAAQKGM
jgi:5-methylcytosine-specific restriction endonuclease McrA